MPFDFSEWIEAYETVAPDESIEFKNESGTWREETDYRLELISSEFQRRGYIDREELTKLTGVRVPMASTILTMAKPTKFAIIDYRALRALGVVKPELLNAESYIDYSTFMECFRNPSSEGYVFYMDIVREIAQQEGLSTREADMALWAYDKSMT